jgi:rSAM/selenodomain-associated transferase 2/rSAM/selenodomain-associated transferase 1
VPGSVKTRLIPLLGPDEAARLAAAFLWDTCACLSRLPWANPVIASIPGELPNDISETTEVWQQGEGDLGDRLECILSRALQDSDGVLAIGADSPGLPSRLLEQARLALSHADAVIGPSADGGFYLLGLRSCPKGLLSRISWSRQTTCAETIAKLQNAYLTVHVLEPWFDVDTPEDLSKLTSLIAARKIAAPHTERFLLGLPDSEFAARLLRCSVIIPALNEMECLPDTLAVLQQHKWIHEVIVADGGSTDGTREWLRSRQFVRLIDAPRGKGPQLNASAQAATGDVLLFLHADCLLPEDAGTALASILQSQGVAGGCFGVRFRPERQFALRMVAAGINWRTRLTGSATGDQGIFVRRRVFDQVGGCPDWPLFEDVDLVRRIKSVGKFTVLPSRLQVSSRRHLAKGVFRTALRIHALRVAFWLGVSPFRLKKWFDDSRPAKTRVPGAEPVPERLS